MKKENEKKDGVLFFMAIFRVRGAPINVKKMINLEKKL